MADITALEAPVKKRALYGFSMTAGGEFDFQLPRPIPNVKAIRFRTLFYTNSDGANGGTAPWDALLLAVDGFQGDSWYAYERSPGNIGTIQANIVLPLVPSLESTNVLSWDSNDFPQIVPAAPITVDSLRIRVYLQYGSNPPQLASSDDISATFPVRATLEFLSS